MIFKQFFQVMPVAAGAARSGGDACAALYPDTLIIIESA